MAYAYRCSGPTAAVINNRTSWGPVSSSSAELPGKLYDRPLSGNFDRIFNAFDRTNSFQIVRNTFEQNGKDEERQIVHGDIVVNRRMSSSYERADCNLAAQTPSSEDDEFYHEKILYSQARQLFPLQEDLADWINKTIGVTYLTGENFLDVLDNGVALCQLASVIHDRAKEALDDGLIIGAVPQIRGRCWQRAARRSFFSRDNTENFITFCRELGVHENLLFESDDLVLHNQPRQVILCLLEVARLATKFNLEPPGLVQLEKEIALEERDSGLDSAMSNSGWQFRDTSPLPQIDCSKNGPPSSPELNENQLAISDQVDNESTKSEETVDSTDSDVPLKPTNELDKRVQLVTRLMERGCNCGAGKCSKLLKVKKVGEGRYNIAGRNVFIRLLKGRHMMVRVGGGWDTLEHFLSRHEPCQVRLVTQGRRSSVLPVPLAHDTTPTPADKTSILSDKSPSLSKSPTPSKSPSLNGKQSPADSGRASRTSSGKTSPIPELTPRRTSTPKLRPALTLPLNSCLDQIETRKKFTPRTRKQSAPSFSTPNTPVTRIAKTPTHENRKSLGSTPSTVTKKSRSISMSTVQKPFCGTDRLNAEAKKSQSLAGTPTKTYALSSAKIRSQSLASTPDKEQKKFCGTDKLNSAAKKSRSMSLASPSATFKPLNKAASVQGGALTAAAIEESIRLSLAATINEDPSPKKPFLHIKAKYRSPPPAPREIPPR